MSDKEYSLNRFRDLFSKEKHIHILERRVPIEFQIKYFRYSEVIRSQAKLIPFPDFECEVLYEELKNEELDKNYIKSILSELAISKNPMAYNILKEYVDNTTDPELLDWGTLAMMECEIGLASELTGEKQVYISTGLGGVKTKLRFCLLLMTSGDNDFKDYERDIVAREANFAFSHADSEIEYIRNGYKYILMMTLISYNIDIKSLIDKLITECNQYGNFLSDTYTITNIKEFTEEEIESIIKRNEDKRRNN